MACEVEVRLPEWLREAIDNNGPADEPPIRPKGAHGSWSGPLVVRAAGRRQVAITRVYASSIGPEEAQCIGRAALPVGALFDLAPGDGTGEPVRVRVVHCTQTVQGYSIGFDFIGDQDA